MNRLRLFPAVVVALSLIGTSAQPQPPDVSAKLFDSSPQHIWNRLYDALWVRRDQAGHAYGVNSLDPLLWDNTKHLLNGESHQRAVRVLDEFLRVHAENQIHDPWKRALLQSSLWAVFNWIAFDRGDRSRLEQEIEPRLSEVLRRLALTSEQIEKLPNNYAEAIASRLFPPEYDAANPSRAFLPADLFQPQGAWVRITGNFEPVALEHAYAASGRSGFQVFIKLPEGRKATLNYLQTLWNAPEPWFGSEIDSGENPNLPQFPIDTMVALVRTMNLFDRLGNLVSTPIIESLQIRVFREIPTRINHHDSNIEIPASRKEQDVYEFRMSHAQLTAVERGEKEFPTFKTQGFDPFESSAQERKSLASATYPILGRCAACHSGSGVHSLQTLRLLLKPNRGQVDPEHGNDPDRKVSSQWWQYADTIPWKQTRYDWGLLNGYWLTVTVPGIKAK